MEAVFAFFGASGLSGLGAFWCKKKQWLYEKRYRDLSFAQHFRPSAVPPEDTYGYFEGPILSDAPLKYPMPSGFDYQVLASFAEDIQKSNQKVTHVWNDNTQTSYIQMIDDKMVITEILISSLA
jgi:hypothetical protein